MVTARSASRSCVVETLFTEFKLVLFADTGLVPRVAEAASTVEATFAANAGGVTTKFSVGVAPLAKVPMLQVMVCVPGPL